MWIYLLGDDELPEDVIFHLDKIFDSNSDTLVYFKPRYLVDFLEVFDSFETAFSIWASYQ